MSQLIEYLCRSGELMNHVTLPVSLFLSRRSDQVRRIVSLSDRRDGRVTVRHWLVSECSANERLPPSEDWVVDGGAVWTDPRVIVPGHDPIWYQEERWCHGGRSPYLPFTEKEQAEYADLFIRAMNNRSHQRARRGWLWQAFLDIYPLDGTLYLKHSKEEPEDLIERFAPWLRTTWAVWRKYLLDFGGPPAPVAAELMVNEAYRAQRLADGLPEEPEQPSGWLPYLPTPVYHPGIIRNRWSAFRMYHG